MRNTTRVTLLSLLIAHSVFAQRPPARAARPSEGSPVNAGASAVLVTALDGAGNSIVGNGVVIGLPDRVLTNSIVLDGAVSLTVTANAGSAALKAEVTEIDTASGVAILRVPGLSVTPFALAKRVAALNDSVFVLTVSLASETAMIRASVRKSELFAGGLQLLTLSSNIAPEANGAPITNANGELAGIAFSSVVDGEQRTYAIPTRFFARFAGNVASRPPARPVATMPSPSLPVSVSVTSVAQREPAPSFEKRKANASTAAGVRDYDKVLPCDETAAHPDDPQRMAAGLTSDKIVPRLALQACQAAVAAHPGSPRFHYQLGRALLMSKRYSEAMAEYVTAESMGYTMGSYGLGIMYGEGEGVPRDLSKAEGYLMKAAAGGAPESIVLNYVFSPAGYSNPALFTAIYNGRMTEASPGPMALYLSAFLQQFSNTDGCRDIISKSAQLGLGQHASMNALGQLFGAMANAPNYSAAGPVAGGLASGYEAGSKLNKNLAGVVDRAHDDALLLYTRHGCSSAVARRFFGNVEAYGLALGNPSLMKELERNGAIKTPE